MTTISNKVRKLAYGVYAAGVVYIDKVLVGEVVWYRDAKNSIIDNNAIKKQTQ